MVEPRVGVTHKGVGSGELCAGLYLGHGAPLSVAGTGSRNAPKLLRLNDVRERMYFDRRDTTVHDAVASAKADAALHAVDADDAAIFGFPDSAHGEVEIAHQTTLAITTMAMMAAAQHTKEAPTMRLSASPGETSCDLEQRRPLGDTNTRAMAFPLKKLAQHDHDIGQ